MRSGGYRLSARVREVAQRTLLLWGRHDEIVDPMFAQRYLQDLPDCRCARAVQRRVRRSLEHSVYIVSTRRLPACLRHKDPQARVSLRTSRRGWGSEAVWLQGLCLVCDIAFTCQI